MKQVGWVVVLAMVGCGDSAQTVDARSAGDAAKDAAADGPDPFACSGIPLPTTAPDPITLSGTTIEITVTGVTALPGVLMEAYQLDGTTVLGSTTSDAGGAYAYVGSTNGVPVDGYFKLTKTGYPSAYAMAATAVYASSAGGLAPMVSDSMFAALYGVTSLTRDPAKATLSVELDDCAGMKLAGGTLTSSSGTVVYTHNGPDQSATATDATGIVYVMNADPGHVVLSATVGAHALRAHTVIGVAGSATFTALHP